MLNFFLLLFFFKYAGWAFSLILKEKQPLNFVAGNQETVSASKFSSPARLYAIPA